MAYTTINKPSDYFNTKLDTGTGSSNSVTGVGFQPDMTWFKHRNGTSEHNIYDAVRGATKRIHTNTAGSENTTVESLQSFNSDGFTVGTNSEVNTNNDNIVAWNWKAGGSGSANTDGSINTTATSVNTTAGFSISTYTGTGSNATVGHGLGSVPKMIIVKRTNATDVWRVYHGSIGATKHLVLNTTAGDASGSNVWNDTAPTSSVFSISTDSAVNASGATYVAYCFAEKKGYSKFGSYTGNGNADGTFIYTGFAPSFVIMKRTDNTGAWYTLDNKRPTYNPKNKYLSPDSSNAESTFTFWDFLSNGFKIRNTGTENNASGGTYIYMAFAEEPLVANSGTDGVPATAR